MPDVKDPTTFEQQIEILRQRGVIIEDDQKCIEILKNLNYYRLTAYFLPYKKPDDTYAPGTDFLHVYRLYEFDRKLRRILFAALEEVEISLRSRFSYYHAHKYGPTGYLEERNFNSRHNHDKFINHIDREIDSNKKVLFVKHHIEKYHGVFPIWVIVELFTFGMLSRFYADLPTEDQKNLARSEYSSTPENIRSWMRCCSDLRNICAHYGRLYYRIFPAMPRGMRESDAALRRLWGAVLALRELFLDSVKWNNEVLPAITSLFEEYSEDIDLYRMAFPRNWESRIKK